MSFVDALYNKEKDTIQVVERVQGKRVYVDYPAEYTFYYADPRGKHRTVYDKRVGKFTTNSYKEFQKERRMHHGTTLYESDFQPLQRCLEKNYKGAEIPTLQTAFFDIEVDMQRYAYDRAHLVTVRKIK